MNLHSTSTKTYYTLSTFVGFSFHIFIKVVPALFFLNSNFLLIILIQNKINASPKNNLPFKRKISYCFSALHTQYLTFLTYSIFNYFSTGYQLYFIKIKLFLFCEFLDSFEINFQLWKKINLSQKPNSSFLSI